MKLALTLLLLSTLTFAADIKSDERALLALHEKARQAHLRGDAVMLTEDMADEVLDSGRGAFDRVTREQFLQRFTNYFKTAKYSSFDNMVPPVAHVAPDGNSGWVAVQIKAHITNTAPDKPPEETDFQYAWLATFEKQQGKWRMTAISYNVPAGK